MKPEAEEEYSQLAREVMEIVLDVAARRLEQALKEVHDSRIAPLRAQIAASEEIRRTSAMAYAKRLEELREERHICEDSRLELLRQIAALKEQLAKREGSDAVL